MDGLDRLISINELSEYLGVPIKTIYDWRLTGHGPGAIAIIKPSARVTIYAAVAG